MTTSKTFSQMRKQSSNFDALQKKLKETQGGKKDYKDSRIWTAQQDKAGNAQAVIRFLPEIEGEELPFVKLFSHSFKGPSGQWFIENCPTTLGSAHKCPVCEANNELWNSGFEDDKKIVSERKRKLNYFSNIYVVSDPANPANEGKVFLFKYGKKIFDKIAEAMKPEFDDEEPMNPFDFWAGANFKLKIVKKDGYANYDKSTFDKPKPLLNGDDDALEALWKSQYKLQELVAADQFKPYSDLSTKVNSVLGGSTKAPKTVESAIDEEDEDLGEILAQRTQKPSATKGKSLPAAEDESIEDLVGSVDLSDDDSLDEFKKLVGDDE